MSNEIKTRPLTPTEQKYTYAQSMQLEGQTGTIGHLRGDFATTGLTRLSIRFVRTRDFCTTAMI